MNSDVLIRLNSVLAEANEFKLPDIKSRAIKHEHYSVSSGGDGKAFIHVQLAVMPGRTQEVLQAASTRLLEFLKAHFANSLAALACSFSVEVRDLNKELYAKQVSGDL